MEKLPKNSASVSELSANMPSAARNKLKNPKIKSGQNSKNPCQDVLDTLSEETREVRRPSNMKVQMAGPKSPSFSASSSNPLSSHGIVCTYCNVYFNSKVDLQVHCRGQDHQTTIMSDEGRDWSHRPPPRGLSADEYALCSTFRDTGHCRLAEQCVGAHSDAELVEWQERFEYRAMKLERAKEKQLHGASYADQLLERLSQLQNHEGLLSEKTAGIITNMSSEPNLRVSHKPSHHTWVISVCPPSPLRVVSLMHDAHRTHFSISDVTQIDNKHCIHRSYEPENNQEWISTDASEALAASIDHSNRLEYKVTITFKTVIYGTFRQAVLLDYGVEPVLMQRLCVDVVPVEDLSALEETKRTILTRTERWCEENVQIIPFGDPKPHELTNHDKSLLTLFPPPTNENFVFTQATQEKVLTKNNYKSRLHDLLHIEELAQFDLMSRFNIKTTLQICNSYLLLPSTAMTAKYSRPGEIFGKLELSSEISEDSHHGRLVLTNCNTLLVSPTTSKSENGRVDNAKDKSMRAVHEVLIEDKTKKEIYLRFSESAVKMLNLKNDEEVTVEVQFQLNRLPLCEMHNALDQVLNMDIIFPEVSSELSIPWNTKRQWGDTIDNKLNPKQREALLAITAPCNVVLPPILIIGPYGTGKTYTLAQGIKQILLQPDTRILICTHSNSAADLYIKDYLHPYVEQGHQEARPLRIYYRNRWVTTVHTDVQQYCLIEMEQGIRKFKMPTEEEILKHRVIVATLNTSRHIVSLNLAKGVFTHILIDEAAQAMECEALTPLAVAKLGTRLVLAGDYMQLSPEVFSPFCEERGLGTSLLERLYDLYPVNSPCKIMLVENYRSHSAIIKYTSDLFYEGRLIASGKQVAHPKFYPLTFFTARGEDFQDPNSTAFHNNSEVYEVCEQVGEIIKHWPKRDWGPINDVSIGVVTPYADQMVRIRAELRKRKFYKVNVERVLNVQGKQFRVIILSTVRTRHTCKAGDDRLDFGFLSNAKLLTTAITRAQSLVAVVGDPVSLCSVGKCRKLWEKFLQTCSDAGSLYGITWSALRSQLDGVELKKTYVLNPLAPEFIPRYLYFSPIQPLPVVPTMPPYVNVYPPPYNSYMSAYHVHPVIGPHALPYIPAAPPQMPPQWPAVPYVAPKAPMVRPPAVRTTQPLVASHPLRPAVPSTVASPFIDPRGPEYRPIHPNVYPVFPYPHPAATIAPHPVPPLRQPVNLESYMNACISALPNTYHQDMKQLTLPSNLIPPVRIKGSSPFASQRLPLPLPPVGQPINPQSEGDKSFQFLNNVHFPERNLPSNASAFSHTIRSRADTESPLSTHSRESSHSSNSDSRGSFRSQSQPVSRPYFEAKLHPNLSSLQISDEVDVQDIHLKRKPNLSIYSGQNGEIAAEEVSLPTPDVVRIIDDIISDGSPTKAAVNHWSSRESNVNCRADRFQVINNQSQGESWSEGGGGGVNQLNRMKPSHPPPLAWLGQSSNMGKVVTVQEVEAVLHKRQKSHEVASSSSMGSSVVSHTNPPPPPPMNAAAPPPRELVPFFHEDNDHMMRSRGNSKDSQQASSTRGDNNVPPPPGFSGLSRLVDPLTQLELRDVEQTSLRTPSVPLYLRRASRETSVQSCSSPQNTPQQEGGGGVLDNLMPQGNNSYLIGPSSALASGSQSCVWNNSDLHSSTSHREPSGFRNIPMLNSGGDYSAAFSQLSHSPTNKTYAGVLRSSLQQSPLDEETNFLLKEYDTDKGNCTPSIWTDPETQIEPTE